MTLDKYGRLLDEVNAAFDKRLSGAIAKTPQRTIRIADDLWTRAQARADEKGETVSEAVRRFLERYAK